MPGMKGPSHCSQSHRRREDSDPNGVLPQPATKMLSFLCRARLRMMFFPQAQAPAQDRAIRRSLDSPTECEWEGVGWGDYKWSEKERPNFSELPESAKRTNFRILS